MTVRDNDGDPEVTISRAGASQVTEGTAVQFTVTATPAPQAGLAVNVGWSERSESGSMLAASPPATVTIPTTGSATLTANTIDDTLEESNSTVTATLNAGTGYAVGVPGSANVTVTDNDGTGPPTTLTVSIDSVTPSSVPEGSPLRIVLKIDPAPSREQVGAVYALDIVENVGTPIGSGVEFVFLASKTTLEIHPPIVVPDTDKVETGRTVKVVINPAYVPDYDYVLDNMSSEMTVNVTDVP